MKPDLHEATIIRMHPLIRFLGGLVGCFAALPSVIGCGFFLLNPAEIAKTPFGALFCVALGPGFSWLTYRWLTIRGELSEQEVYQRGLLRTVRLPTAEIAKVRRIENDGERGLSSKRRYYSYVFLDHAGKSIGVVPASLEYCSGWNDFKSRLYQLGAGAGSRIEDMGDKRATAHDYLQFFWHSILLPLGEAMTRRRRKRW